ncbi:unnamed protein product [Strongylus vulgaris]|uniref:Uncharacterized protein n=1 Tax=Strongylus vulgaris TaxID=40348 RepID=A0A3P7JMX1_STRVU|nr:unnamed protein product [Strongylus vulgaris]
MVSSSRISSLTLNRPADLFASTSTDDGFVTIGTTDPDNGAFGESTVELKCSKRPLCALFMDDERTKQSLVLVGSSSGIHIVDAQSGAIFRFLTSKGDQFTIELDPLSKGTLDYDCVSPYKLQLNQVIATF